jgi:hypothetical protein
VENELNAIAAMQHVPPDLTITYDDMHGLWGGSILIVRGNGSLERQTKLAGSPTVKVTQQTISEQTLLDLVRLLVELRAWEQRTPDRQLVPDESRAQLNVSVQGNTSRVWERFNEMPTNNRLIQIKTWMETL